MKCRDMNPGNVNARAAVNCVHYPSMKCRDMNPGNKTFLLDYVPGGNPQ